MILKTTVAYDTDQVLTLIEFSNFLVDVPATEDPEVIQCIKDAIRQMENDTGRAYALRTYELYLDSWSSRIMLPMPPLNSVTSVEYLNEIDVWTTVNTADYNVYAAKVHGINQLDCFGGYIEPVDSWPSDVKKDIREVIRVTFIAGYDNTGTVFLVPDIAKRSARLLTSHFYSAKRGEDSSESLKEYERIVSDLIAYSFV